MFLAHFPCYKWIIWVFVSCFKKKERKKTLKKSFFVCQAHCSLLHTSVTLWEDSRGQGGVRRAAVSSKSPSPFFLLLLLLPLCLTPSPPSALKESVWQQDIPSLCSQYTHCWLIVTRWTLTAQPTLTMCLLDTAACGASPPWVPRAPELCLCGADGRWGPELDGEVIFMGAMRRQSG